MTEANNCDCSSSSESIRILINPEKCSGCGLCAEVCPFGLPEKTDAGKYEINLVDSCIECSACQRNCPVNAIIMQEQVGCGCLWDAKERLKAEKRGKPLTNISCGCGSSPSQTNNCCSSSNNGSQEQFEIKILDAFNTFIKPNIGSCCALPPEDEKSSNKDED